jgi:hypothetical protein
MKTITILEVHPRMEQMLEIVNGINGRTRTDHWGGPSWVQEVEVIQKIWKHQKECWIAQNKMIHGRASSILTSAATKLVLLERI